MSSKDKKLMDATNELLKQLVSKTDELVAINKELVSLLKPQNKEEQVQPEIITKMPTVNKGKPKENVK